jgi:hypothetical protein
MRYVLIVILALVLVLQSIAGAAPAAANQDDNSCQLKAKEAKDCSLCCAIGGFNKFDSQAFQAGRGCRCFKDEKEAAINQRHKQRKP